MNKAINIKEIYKNFAPELYITEENIDFYIPLYEKDLKRFENQLIENNILEKSFFIAGQSGNGKSTILSLLGKENPKIKDKYEIKYLSGKEIFIYEDIDIIDLLLVIGSYFIKDDEELSKTYFQELNIIQDTNDGILNIESIEDNFKEKEGEIKTSLNSKINFMSILSNKSSLELSYKKNSILRDVSRKVFKAKEEDIINLINEIISDYKIKKNTDKEILLIIDDLEKKSSDKLFLKDISKINNIKCVKIVTMPIHLRRTKTFEDLDVREFTLKINDLEGNRKEKDFNLLKELVKKRIENLDLINDEVINKAIEQSGANLRQLVRLIHISANEADTFDSSIIEDKELDYAIEFIQRGLSSPAMMKQNILIKILENKRAKLENSDIEELGEVIKMGLVFAYLNGEIWYEINPIIKKIVEKYI